MKTTQPSQPSQSHRHAKSTQAIGAMPHATTAHKQARTSLQSVSKLGRWVCAGLLALPLLGFASADSQPLQPEASQQRKGNRAAKPRQGKAKPGSKANNEAEARARAKARQQGNTADGGRENNSPKPVVIPGFSPDSADEADDAKLEAPAAVMTPEDARIIADYFQRADHDLNGWISFREARRSMSVDRLTFAGFDDNADGRIRLEEFQTTYLRARLRGGSFEAPQVVDDIWLFRDAEQLKIAFDRDGSGALEAEELGDLLLAYKHDAVPTNLVGTKLDSNGSGSLEVDELALLSQLLQSRTPLDGEDGASGDANSIEDLYGIPVEREGPEYRRTQHPPLIRGPLRPFGRLDLDRDGFVDLEELERLQRPQTISVRLAAVVAALDSNQDGRLSRAEFQASLE